MSTQPLTQQQINAELTAPLTQPGGAFSGVAGPTVASGPASIQMFDGMPLSVFENLFGYDPVVPPDPFFALLPSLTPAMAASGTTGQLAEFVPSYDWAVQVVSALRSLFGMPVAGQPAPEIQILNGDDRATPGAVPANTAPTNLPGVYTPGVAPSGGGFTNPVNGVTYLNLCLRFLITPPVGKPYIVGGLGPASASAFNVALIVHSFLADEQDIRPAVKSLTASILGATETVSVG